jgi:hypothetical protein
VEAGAASFVAVSTTGAGAEAEEEAAAEAASLAVVRLAGPGGGAGADEGAAAASLLPTGAEAGPPGENAASFLLCLGSGAAGVGALTVV